MPEIAKKSRRFKVDVPLDETEQAQFRKFCEDTGRGQGPWLRTLILKGMREELARPIQGGAA